MRRILLLVTGITVVATLAIIGLAQASGPNKVLQMAKVGGEGGTDYIFAESEGRRLYIPRSGPARLCVYDLDSLKLVSEIANAGGHGAAVDPKSGHGFVSGNPVTMFDAKALTIIKTIQTEGSPDGILFDPYNQRVWIYSHRAPNATIIDAKDGSIVNTLDLGGAPEQAVTDGHGHMWVDLEDKDQIAAVDTKALKVTATYGLDGKGGGPGGLAFDPKNHILFASTHTPPMMVMLNADTGKVLDALPIGAGTDGATFNPNTMEAFSTNGQAGNVTIIKEESPTKFSVEQNLPTMPGARTLTLDSKANHVLTMASERAPAPAPAPDAPKGGGRGRGGATVPGSFTIVVIGSK
jgi:DNA-binding beta-propeller fold protein YncE